MGWVSLYAHVRTGTCRCHSVYWSPEAWITGKHRSSLSRYWEQNSGPLKEKCVSLTTNPSLHSLDHHCNIAITLSFFLKNYCASTRVRTEQVNKSWGISAGVYLTLSIYKYSFSVLSRCNCDGYSWLPTWLNQEWATIQKWRPHL